MNSKEFFWATAAMRAAQKEYFKTRSDRAFRAARALENSIDTEIRRVKEIEERKQREL